MTDPKIEPNKITKPIQLLAAWLAGLVLVNGAFLTAASLIYVPSWAPALLVVACVVNVPLFLISIFVLQTKFRPEMQEDEFYHKYLEKRFSTVTGKSEVVETKVAEFEDLPAKLVPRKAWKYGRVRPLPFEKSREDFYVHINDLLPSFSSLASELTAAGIKPTATFGSTSQNPITPTPFVISVGENVPLDVVKKALSVTRKHGIEGIGFTRNANGIHQKKIYIGAYGYNVPSTP